MLLLHGLYGSSLPPALAVQERQTRQDCRNMLSKGVVAILGSIHCITTLMYILKSHAVGHSKLTVSCAESFYDIHGKRAAVASYLGSLANGANCWC